MIKDIVFKIGYDLGIHRLFNLSVVNKRIIMLCLHRVNPVNDPLFPRLHPNTFKKLIRLLKREYIIAAIQDLPALDLSGTFKKPVIVISFDDGYKDFIDYAMPVIDGEKVSVNHNIVVHSADTGQLIWTQRLNNILSFLDKTGTPLNVTYEDYSFHPDPSWNIFQTKRELFKIMFGRPFPFISGFTAAAENKYSFLQPSNEMMNWDDIRTCKKAGVDIGSHTFYHSSLDHEGDPFFLNVEIKVSKSAIEKQIASPVYSFAFPNGLMQQRAYDASIDAGYQNLLLIDEVDYRHIALSTNGANLFKRRLVGGHTSEYENIFNVVGLHKAFHF